MRNRKDLLGTKDLSGEEITEILDLAREMKAQVASEGGKCTDALRGRSVVTLFYENSTRTRNSFELAAKFQGATVTSVAADSSSVKKGETLIDTGRTLDALGTDVIVLRHPASGSARLLAENVRAHVLNGGDGQNEHPTQALLDLFTMREEFGRIEGLKVCIAGDLKFSRVARSDLYALKTMSAEVRLCAPRTLCPPALAELGGVFYDDLREAAAGADVLMGLRIQLERQDAGLFPSTGEYAKFYGLNEDVLALAAPGAIVMHPGPMNRGVEISDGLANHPACRVEEQVTNGLVVRMAVLRLLLGVA